MDRLKELAPIDGFNKKLLEEADRIIDMADNENVLLRILGSIAFRIHCPKYVHYLDRLDRKLTDLDFASYSAHRNKVEKLLADMGYVTQSYVSMAAATIGRSIYWRSDNKELKVDIFWDRLSMNHTVSFLQRLEFDKPTIPLSEMLQEKLQIVQLNLKDVKDTIILLLEHRVATDSSDKETIDLSSILKQASSDWGYYYTFTTNLRKIRDVLQETDVLSDQEKSVVDGKIAMIADALESVSKSLSWKLRAKVGPKTKWYNEVQ